MKRELYRELEKWKRSKYRQPLILKGARQVGKTFLLKEFGRTSFSRFHYFNFEEQDDLKKIFEGNLEVDRILQNLRLDKTKVTENHELIILDEIQLCPRALTSLKYFAENAPEIYICSAGSLIGVTLAQESFPVGKVNYLDLTPFTFSEYLEAVDSWCHEALEEARRQPIDSYRHTKLLERFNEFAAIGGLPRAVQMAKEFDKRNVAFYEELKNFHESIIRTYQSDFAKHAGKVNAVHITTTFSNVPSQLSRQLDGATKRFVFKGVVPGLRGYSDLEGPIEWLKHAGLLHKVKLLKKGLLPTESFTEENLFKLYLFDTALLLRMLKLPYEVAIENSYGMHKGFVMENLILAQMRKSSEEAIYYWAENKAEVDFVRILGQDLIPIEVKSSHRMRSKSLQSYINRYNPKFSIVLSTNNFYYSKSNNTCHVPVYLAEYLDEIRSRIG